MNFKSWLFLTISLFCIWQVGLGYSNLNEMLLTDTSKQTTTINLTYYDYDIGSKYALASKPYSESLDYFTKLEIYNIIITTLNIVICLISFMFCFTWYIEENKISIKEYFTKK